MDGICTFIAWDNVNTAFGRSEGYINTEVGGEFYPAETSVIDITLKSPVDGLSLLKFNPFIFVNERSHEIHLVDHDLLQR